MKNISTPVKVVAVLAALVVVYLLYTKYKVKEEVTKMTEAEPVKASVPNSNTGTSKVNNDTVLKKGSVNDRVLWLQGYYNQYVVPVDKMPKLDYDGKFGTETEKAVKHVMGSTSTTWTKFKARVDFNYGES